MGCTKGRRESFDRFYRHFKESEWFICQRKIANAYELSSEETEDIMQSTFEALWLRWDAIKEPSHYFRKALRYQILLYKRNKQREPTITSSFNESIYVVDMLSEAAQLQQETYDAMMDSLDEILTKEEREVIIRHFIHQQPYKQIADSLGISSTAARQATMRGKRKLIRKFPGL
jgi:RNA polymerase sigma-70 factor (ECF subfamily)